MKRQIIKIDETLCDGCGHCVSGCHEGALELIDGKARIVSELYCDGLGACIGDCPQGAITIEEREAEAYDEIKVMDRIIEKGEETIKAHLKHLHHHNEHEYIKQGINRLKEKNIDIDLSFLNTEKPIEFISQPSSCPGSLNKAINISTNDISKGNVTSQLKQWPVQLHLINPSMQFYESSDLLICADCVAFAMGDFHSKLLAGKTLVIACPKLDSSKEIYVEKLVELIDERKINTITVAVMVVPCCSGLLQITQMAVSQAKRKIPVKKIVIGIEGKIESEDWI